MENKNNLGLLNYVLVLMQDVLKLEPQNKAAATELEKIKFVLQFLPYFDFEELNIEPYSSSKKVNHKSPETPHRINFGLLIQKCYAFIKDHIQNNITENEKASFLETFEESISNIIDGLVQHPRLFTIEDPNIKNKLSQFIYQVVVMPELHDTNLDIEHLIQGLALLLQLSTVKRMEAPSKNVLQTDENILVIYNHLFDMLPKGPEESMVCQFKSIEQIAKDHPKLFIQKLFIKTQLFSTLVKYSQPVPEEPIYIELNKLYKLMVASFKDIQLDNPSDIVPLLKEIYQSQEFAELTKILNLKFNLFEIEVIDLIFSVSADVAKRTYPNEPNHVNVFAKWLQQHGLEQSVLNGQLKLLINSQDEDGYDFWGVPIDPSKSAYFFQLLVDNSSLKGFSSSLSNRWLEKFYQYIEKQHVISLENRLQFCLTLNNPDFTMRILDKALLDRHLVGPSEYDIKTMNDFIQSEFFTKTPLKQQKDFIFILFYVYTGKWSTARSNPLRDLFLKETLISFEQRLIKYNQPNMCIANENFLLHLTILRLIESKHIKKSDVDEKFSLLPQKLPNISLSEVVSGFFLAMKYPFLFSSWLYESWAIKELSFFEVIKNYFGADDYEHFLKTFPDMSSIHGNLQKVYKNLYVRIFDLRKFSGEELKDPHIQPLMKIYFECKMDLNKKYDNVNYIDHEDSFFGWIVTALKSDNLFRTLIINEIKNDTWLQNSISQCASFSKLVAIEILHAYGELKGYLKYLLVLSTYKGAYANGMELSKYPSTRDKFDMEQYLSAYAVIKESIQQSFLTPEGKPVSIISDLIKRGSGLLQDYHMKIYADVIKRFDLEQVYLEFLNKCYGDAPEFGNKKIIHDFSIGNLDVIMKHIEEELKTINIPAFDKTSIFNANPKVQAIIHLKEKLKLYQSPTHFSYDPKAGAFKFEPIETSEIDLTNTLNI